jgi:ribosome-binding protein aMBF1 (putative translation factor)
MDNQDWTTVILKKRSTPISKDSSQLDTTIHLSKLEQMELPPLKKRVNPESIQALIRKRLELGLTQEKTDQKCSFPRNTIKDIESHKSLPTSYQHSIIQQQLGIQIKIEHI